MPKSSIRKKKLRKKPPKKKYDEYFDGGYYEVIRKGRNVFTRLKMTEEEHAQWMLQIKENRPKLYNEIKQLINEVTGLINSYNKIFIIAGIVSFAFDEWESNPEVDDSDPELAIEYCHSIALTSGNSNHGILPSKEILNKIYELLKTIRSKFKYYYLFEDINSEGLEVKSEIRASIIVETLYIRGEGYLKHIKELFTELFSPHDVFFQKHYSFKSSDIIKTFERLEHSFRSRLTSVDKKPNLIFLERFQRWQLSGANSPGSFLQQNPGFAVENGMAALYYILEISSFEKLYRIRHFNETQEKVVKALALKFGDNKDFGDCEVLNESKIYSYPSLREKMKIIIYFL